ncbi:amino acid ABC transporter ATP-binding protein [Leifsonia kafniensis]|uniref:Amino acid ABC transporter ATP-binding protein n=1 Tax=Leifsonia kafniensis TaxID=475957 RepID=A0ABP7L0Z8_9MICO
MKTPVIEIRDLHKTYGKSEVLRGVDLSINSGEVMAILGRSGGGKSTLLRCINLLETPTAGDIRVGEHLAFSGGKPATGKNLVRLRRSVGMLFQGLNVFPHLSVVENVALPMVRSLGTDESVAVKTALDLLDKVKLTEKALAMPSQLSGGQLQRVALARALALNPLALLFDEPTSALDPESTLEVLQVMKDLSADGMTMVIVTHEIGFAFDVAKTIVMIDEGIVVDSGSPAQLASNSQHDLTKRFLREHLQFDSSSPAGQPRPTRSR